MKYPSILILVLFFFLFSGTLRAQDKNEQPNPKKSNSERKVVFGGMIGLQFGTVTAIDISPTIGYFFNPRLMATLGLSYQYYRESVYNSNYASSIFGMRTSLSYTFIDHIGQNLAIKSNFGLFGETEFEMLNLDTDYSNRNSPQKVNRFWLPGFLVGIGMKQNFGRNSFFSISVLFNIIATSKTPYENPLLRVGIYF